MGSYASAGVGGDGGVGDSGSVERLVCKRDFPDRVRGGELEWVELSPSSKWKRRLGSTFVENGAVVWLRVDLVVEELIFCDFGPFFGMMRS